MGGMFDYVEEHFGHSLAHEDIQDYWFQNLPRSDIFTALRSRGFYRNLDVITGAVRAVNRLREEYNKRLLKLMQTQWNKQLII